MYATKCIIDTDTRGAPKSLPALPPNAHLEAIFLETTSPPQIHQTTRHPHPNIAGKIKICGDIFSSASTQDWNPPR